MSKTYSGDYITARRKITQGTDWRGTANVSIGGETMEIGHRLLTEDEFLELKRVIPLSELQEYEEEDQSEAEERLQELQAKDDLTESEEGELERLQAEVASMQEEIEDVLGEDAYEMILESGKRAIAPTDADIDDFLDADPDLQCQIAGVDSIKQLPAHMSRDEAEEILEEDMQRMVEGQPYPIKFTIGMQAFQETVRVLGNGITREAST